MMSMLHRKVRSLGVEIMEPPGRAPSWLSAKYTTGTELLGSIPTARLLFWQTKPVVLPRCCVEKREPVMKSRNDLVEHYDIVA